MVELQRGRVCPAACTAGLFILFGIDEIGNKITMCLNVGIRLSPWGYDEYNKEKSRIGSFDELKPSLFQLPPLCPPPPNVVIIVFKNSFVVL